MVTRRKLLLAAAFAPFAREAGAQALTCGRQTLSQTEGPFFSPNSPLRASLIEKGSTGDRFVLTAVVLSPQCRPVPGALVDLWHADEEGAYDNKGFRFRGHQFADAQGRVRFETIVPALYPGRTRHYHVKVQAPGRRILTTQLYFPDEAANRRDGIYRRELEMKVAKSEGSFDFVVDA
jgi:protocatechuate 3,4-dioxygenase beta subunit